MKNIIKILTIFHIVLLVIGCSTKDKNLKIDKPQDSILLANLKENLILENYQLNLNSSKITQTENYIKIDFPNKIFPKGSSIPTESRGVLEQIAQTLKKFPTMVIQINTYSNDLIKEEENLDLANNRAFNIAEIMDNCQIKNEIFVKGHPIEKDKNILQKNKKLEIFLYKSIDAMSNQTD